MLFCLQSNCYAKSHIFIVMMNLDMERCYAECHYAECHYAECHYAECHYTVCHFAYNSSVMQSVTFLLLC